MNDMEEVLIGILRQIKGEYFDIREQLITDGYITSFDLLYLIQLIEEKYSIEIPLTLIEPVQFNDIESMIKLIKMCQEKQ